MKTLAIASQKGGAGKTTLAGHLAVLAGKGVALLDLDPQGSLAAWWNSRKVEFPHFAAADLRGLPGKIAALAASDYRFAIIDTPPAVAASTRAAIDLADLVLIPCRPSPHDLRAVGATVQIVRDAEKPFLFVLTQAKAGSRLTVQAVAALSAHGEVSTVIIHDRVDYAASMIDGLTVGEVSAKSRSAVEMAELWQVIKARLADGGEAAKKERQKTR